MRSTRPTAEQLSLQMDLNIHEVRPSQVEVLSPSAPSTWDGVRHLAGPARPHEGLSTPQNRLRLPRKIQERTSEANTIWRKPEKYERILPVSSGLIH